MWCGGKENFYSYNSKVMVARYFLRRLAFLSIIFGLIVPAQFAYATPPTLPCSRYSFEEVYSLDQNSLPAGVSLLEVAISRDGVDKNYFLKNSNSKPLVIDLGPPSQNKLKFVDDKAYRKIAESDTEWYEEKQVAYADAGSLYVLARRNKDIPNPLSFSSDTKPTSIAPVRFSIAAQYNEQPIAIIGTLSYVLVEHDCAAEKAAVPQTRGFWAAVLGFFVSLKFW